MSDTLGVALFVLDDAGRITQWTGDAPSLFGWSSDEIIGQVAADVLFAGMPTSEVAWSGTVTVSTASGEPVEVEMRTLPLEFQSESLTVVLSTLPRHHDVSIGPQDSFGALLAADRATRAAAAVVEQWLEPYRQAARDAISEPQLDSLLRDALAAIAGVLGADAVGIALANEDGSALVGRAGFGLPREIDRELQIPIGIGASGAVLASRRPHIVNRLESADFVTDAIRVSGLQSYVGVPLLVGDHVLGVIHALSRTPGKFAEGHADALSLFADPIASAIERVRLFEHEREARQTAEQVAERLRALQRITASLAGTSKVRDVCRLILEEAGERGDGGERGIWMLREGRLMLVAGSGLSETYPEIPLDPSLPAAQNLADGTPLFAETRAELERRWPRLAGGATAAFAGLPLIVDGRRLGVMAVGFTVEHRFPESERSYLATIAEQAAVAIARARARAELETTSRVAEERRDQLAFLARASDRLAASLDFDVTRQTIAELAVPLLCDRCELFVLEESGLTHHSVAREHSEEASAGRFGESIEERALLEGVVEVGQNSSFDALVEHRGAGAVLALRARGRTIGALALLNAEERTMSATERLLAEELAARAAVAIDNALAFVRESEIASRLTATLLPSRLPVMPGLEVAARYEAGSAGLEVGGDFYDFIEVGDRRWLVAVGDVQGKGVEAAAVTGFVRHTLRSAALSESSPAAVLRHLNEAMIRNIFELATDPEYPWDGARLCTAAVILLEQRTDGWSARISRAGHPAPVLRYGDGTVALLGAPGLILGVDRDFGYAESEHQLPVGSALVCFTDGASDRPSEHAMLGSEGIAELVADAGDTAGEIVERISAARVRGSGVLDDLVVLAIRVERAHLAL